MDYPLKTYRKVEGAVEKAQPFFIASRPDNDQMVIIIHGFTSSPYHMHFMAHTLARQGYDVDTLLLAGHGGSLERLAQTRPQDWVQTAETALQTALQKYQKVYILGYSFGANLAVHLGVRYPQIRGLVCLGIPIVLNREKSIRTLLPLAKLFMKKYKKRWIAPEEIAGLYERGHHLYIPIPTLVEFRRFIQHYTKPDIPRLQLPVLIGHPRRDQVADPSSSEYLFHHLQVADKTLYIMNQGDHHVETGVSRDFVAKKILDFLKKH